MHTSPDLLQVELNHAMPTTTPVIEQPRLDEDGLLWFGRQWVVIPDAQLGVVELLLGHPDELVRTSTIATTYMRGGCSGHHASIRTMVHRIVRRFDQVGLTLHIVRSKGVIYERPVP